MSLELQPYPIEVPLWTKTSKCAYPPPDRSVFPCWEGNPYEAADSDPAPIFGYPFCSQAPWCDYMYGNLQVLPADHGGERVMVIP